MTFNINSTKLFDGLASLVAKAVEKENVRIVRLNSNEPQSCTCAGNAAVKTEEAMFEIDVAGWLMERFAQNDAQQLLENYKASLRKEGDRTAVYKQKWEDTEAILEKERQDREDERQSWEEEKKRMEKKIIQLEAQLTWEKENPRNQTVVQGDQTIVQGDQHNTNSSKVHSETKKEEMKVGEGGIGVGGAVTTNQQTELETKKWCEFIVRGAAYKHSYKTDEQFYEQIRLYWLNRNSPDVVDYLKQKERDGLCDFKSLKPADIYDQLVMDLGIPKFEKATFVRNCSSWNPK